MIEYQFQKKFLTHRKVSICMNILQSSSQLTYTFCKSYSCLNVGSSQIKVITLGTLGSITHKTLRYKRVSKCLPL